ncbi:unnamed protein product [Paramecium primaurelia]|uniref:Uncharacterized protein n=2 Tax=Paramecium TaxID=5884 RepID=A0A8S1RXM4_9CILI|nr:unnamed protein product [Paramecium primaurelia]CAD8131569.1 unnamed protein product [Paramecium pentaurelia]
MDQKKKSQLIQGYCNGLLFSIFLGIYDYPLNSANATWTKSQVRLDYAKFIGQKALCFPPMLALFQITCAYMEDWGYSYPTQVLAAAGVGICYLSIVKYK